MKRATPKFRVGQVVMLKIEDYPFKITRRLFDPSDDWEYGFGRKLPAPFHFEEDLRPLTKRERGPARKER